MKIKASAVALALGVLANVTGVLGQDAPAGSVTLPSATAPTGWASAPAANTAYTQTDIDILYFVYNLEVFEANFYSCVASGTSVSPDYLGGGPAPIGCPGKAPLNSTIATLAAELAREESAHVALLYTALKAAGVSPVAPLTNISAGVFNTLALGAFQTNSLNPPFNPYVSDVFFLHAGFLFEDAGASGYLGALNSITNTVYKLTAAQIGSTEAYHASALRTFLFQILDTVPAYGLRVQDITSNLVNFENTVAGPPQIKYNIFTNQGAGSSVSNVNANALVPTATPLQVLHLVTGGAPAGSGGGFFPNNLNGNVKN